jgi:hypothetical protein
MLTRRRCGLALIFAAALCWIIGGEWISIHAGIPENHFVDAFGGLSIAIAGLVVLDRRPGNMIGPLMFGYVFLAYPGSGGQGQLRCAEPAGRRHLVRAEIPCDD